MTGFQSVCLSLLFTGNVALCFLNNAYLTVFKSVRSRNLAKQGKRIGYRKLLSVGCEC